VSATSAEWNALEATVLCLAALALSIDVIVLTLVGVEKWEQRRDRRGLGRRSLDETLSSLPREYPAVGRKIGPEERTPVTGVPIPAGGKLGRGTGEDNGGNQGGQGGGR
jgi:hypothetical protein